MTSQYKHKNLLFYSNRDPASLAFLSELTKNPLLDQQFVKVCVNDPRVKIPQLIINYNKIPVIVVPGFDKPILGEDAFTWLQNNNFSEKSNGSFDFGNLDESQAVKEHSRLAEEFKSTDYNQFHNTDYNLGFQNPQQQINSEFSNVSNDQQADPTRINTFDDTESKRNSKAVLAQRMELLRQQRDNEFANRPMVGGLDRPNPNQQQSQPPPQQQQQQQQHGPMGAQMSAFGNFGSNLDQAYMAPPNNQDSQQQQQQAGSRPGLTYDPNPGNIPPMPQMPQRNQFQNHNVPQIPQLSAQQLRTALPMGNATGPGAPGVGHFNGQNFPGNRPHPNMLLNQMQPQQVGGQVSNRGHANPYHPGMPAGPPSSIPMMTSHQGLPQPSGAGGGNYYQL